MGASTDELSQVPNVRPLGLFEEMQILPCIDMRQNSLVPRTHLHVPALTFPRVEIKPRILPAVGVPVLRTGRTGKEEVSGFD